jgi:transcription termination factor Rho
VTETTTPDVSTPSAAEAPKRTGGGLGGKVLAELQEIASELGITGAEKMRKGALIDAIKIARGDAGTSTKAAVKAATAPPVDTAAPAAVNIQETLAEVAAADSSAEPAKASRPSRSRRATKAKADAPVQDELVEAPVEAPAASAAKADEPAQDEETEGQAGQREAGQRQAGQRQAGQRQAGRRRAEP